MADLPESTRPIVGYAMWQMAHGIPAANIPAMIAVHRDYPALSPEMTAEIVSAAQRNLAAREALTGHVHATYVGDAYGIPRTEHRTIGLRVLLTMADRSGRQTTASVVVNVSSDASIDEALAMVEHLAASGQLNMPEGSDRNVATVTASLAASFLGGYERGISLATPVR